MRMKKVLCGLLIAACLSAVSVVSASEVGVENINFLLDKANSYVNKITSVEQKQENLFNLAEVDKLIIQAVAETDLKLFGYHQVNSNNILQFDYGEIHLQVNSNKLAHKESNVIFANFSKMQNQNFERMQVAF